VVSFTGATSHFVSTTHVLVVARFYMALSGHPERMKWGNPAGVAGAQPMRGSARGHPSLKPFLCWAEQRESDGSPYASFS
jgi:hypothetical protein